jgi:hypothetical protein
MTIFKLRNEYAANACFFGEVFLRPLPFQPQELDAISKPLSNISPHSPSLVRILSDTTLPIGYISSEVGERLSYILLLVFLWVVLGTCGLTIYLMPSIFAFKIGHPYRWVILAANALCGWTVLGWFVLLILVPVSGSTLERRRLEGRSSLLSASTRSLTQASTGKCPDCKDAYLSGNDVCPSCGRALGSSVAADNRAIILLVCLLALIAIVFLIIKFFV